MTFLSSDPPEERPKRKRRRMLVRSRGEELPPLQLTERDCAVLLAVYEYRVLTTAQIHRLFFLKEGITSEKGSLVQCQERLKRLFHHGYLHRDEQPVRLGEGRQPLIYFLDRRGANALAAYLEIEPSELDWRLRDTLRGAKNLFLNHHLKCNDVRIAFTLAAEKLDHRIETWMDDRTLKRQEIREYVTLREKSGKETRAAIVPDAFVRLAVQDEMHTFFVEVDLATTIGLSNSAGRRDWARKME